MCNLLFVMTSLHWGKKTRRQAVKTARAFSKIEKKTTNQIALLNVNNMPNLSFSNM